MDWYTYTTFSKVDDSQHFDVSIKKVEVDKQLQKQTWRAQKDNTSMQRKYVVNYLKRIDWRS